MNFIKRTIYAAAAIVMTGAVTSCNYLDIDKELSKNLDKDEVFSNASYLKRWYGEIYQTCPNYSESGLDVQNEGGYYNSWAILSGELVCAHPNVLKYGQNTYTTSSSQFHRWWNCYKQIRQGMIFLDRAPESLGDPADVTGYISKEDMDRMKAEVIYLIAYNYFLLFELYGPTPIITEVADPENTGLDYARASVDEMVEHIDGLLERVISGDYADALQETLKNGEAYDLANILRPTKAAALALRARLWVYAASPLYNGGFEEALSVVNKDGKRLFPDKDDSKWQTAKTHLEALLSFADAHGMGLYKSATNDPHLNVYELFQSYNDEILWANGNNDYQSSTTKMEARTIPGNIPGGMGNVGFYQEMVDMFFTENGLTIDEDPAYNEAGFQDWANPCTNISGTVSSVKTKHVDKHIFNMYTHREPRFYAAVTYEGKSWHMQRDQSTYKDWGAYFSSGGSSYKDQTMHARAGYLLYKFNNRTMLNVGSYNKSWARPWIYFRLADFYLYYAEVCNEIDPDDPNIIRYLDMVRERAGIPGYAQLKDNGKDIVGDQAKQREAIHRERIVEMIGEGNYYFDMRRWMKLGWGYDEDGNYIKDNEDKVQCRFGMDISRKAADFNSNGIALSFVDRYGEGTYYNRIVKDRYPWKKAMLFYPIPYNEMQKSQLTVQNPLWD